MTNPPSRPLKPSEIDELLSESEYEDCLILACDPSNLDVTEVACIGRSEVEVYEFGANGWWLVEWAYRAPERGPGFALERADVFERSDFYDP